MRAESRSCPEAKRVLAGLNVVDTDRADSESFDQNDFLVMLSVLKSELSFGVLDFAVDAGRREASMKLCNLISAPATQRVRR